MGILTSIYCKSINVLWLFLLINIVDILLKHIITNSNIVLLEVPGINQIQLYSPARLLHLILLQYVDESNDQLRRVYHSAPIVSLHGRMYFTVFLSYICMDACISQCSYRISTRTHVFHSAPIVSLHGRMYFTVLLSYLCKDACISQCAYRISAGTHVFHRALIVSLQGRMCFTVLLSYLCKDACISHCSYRISARTHAFHSAPIVSQDPNSLHEGIARLERCVSDIREWMVTNKLKLNDSKSEFVIVAPKRYYSKILLWKPTISIGTAIIKPSPTAKILGAYGIFLSDLRVILGAAHIYII